jgi:hypothetical protein
VFHDPSVQTEAEKRFRCYVEYGRALMRLVEALPAAKAPARAEV